MMKKACVLRPKSVVLNGWLTKDLLDRYQRDDVFRLRETEKDAIVHAMRQKLSSSLPHEIYASEAAKMQA